MSIDRFSMNRLLHILSDNNAATFYLTGFGLSLVHCRPMPDRCHQAVLKIIKHCTESLPQMVAGSLLGLDQTGVLEVMGVDPSGKGGHNRPLL